MSRRGITKSERNLLHSALLNGAYKGVTWGDICDQKMLEQKELDEKDVGDQNEDNQ